MSGKTGAALALAWAVCLALSWTGCTGGGSRGSDEAQIIRQLQNHHYYWDSRDLEKFEQLFTVDAVTRSYAAGNPEPVWSSPDLETLMTASRSYLEKQEGIQSRHHPSAIQFLELTDTTANTRHTVLITHQEKDQPHPQVSMSATYTIHWVKTNDGWRIRQRDFYRD